MLIARDAANGELMGNPIKAVNLVILWVVVVIVVGDGRGGGRGVIIPKMLGGMSCSYASGLQLSRRGVCDIY